MKPGYDPFKFGEGIRKRVTKQGPNGVERLYKKAPSGDPENVNRVFRKSNYYGGTAVADALGCNLRCVFCWARDSLRDCSRIGKEGTFFSPLAVAKALDETIEEYGLKYARITEGEPTLDMDHLCGILGNLSKPKVSFKFILETNGLLFGRYPEFVKRVAEYDKEVAKHERFLHIRVSIKGPTPEKFRMLTFADSRFHDLQFDAIKNCLDSGLNVHPATMLDFVESKREIDYLADKLGSIGMSISHDLEWERLFLEDYVMDRLKKYQISFKMIFDQEEAKTWKKR
jgi:uncharacterized Fe-S cluster-containing radical SAM superfamily protein